MIKKLEINGVHAEVDDKLKKYVMKKIGSLDRYVPKKARTSLHAEVFLKESKKTKDKKETCEVVLHVPDEIIRISESRMNMTEAVDIVENKLKVKLVKYKEKHDQPRLRRRLMQKIRRRQ